MPIEIRLPNITASTEKEQLSQIKSYLYQLAQQLQWAIGNIGAPSGADSSDNTLSGLPSGVVAQTTFNAIKPFIIKSPEIINSYYEVINDRIEGQYVSDSDFSEYSEQTGRKIDALQEDLQQTDEDVGSIGEELLKVKTQIGGVCMKSTLLHGTAGIDINTSYSEFNGSGIRSQTFFVFGEDNGILVYGLARVSNTGATSWSGTDGISLTTKSGGVLTIVLPNASNDVFTIISGIDFSI